MPNSPAERSGIEINDEIIALNGYRVRTTDLNERISSLGEGSQILLALFRNDKLKEIKVRLEYFGFAVYAVKKVSTPSDVQKNIYEGWLKTPY